MDDRMCLVSLLTDSIGRERLSALSPAGNVGQAFGEAVEPTDPARGMVLHEEDGTTAAFRPRVGAFGASSILPRPRGLCQEDFRVWI